MATHSSVLAWRIPWTEEPGGLPTAKSGTETPQFGNIFLSRLLLLFHFPLFFIGGTRQLYPAVGLPLIELLQPFVCVPKSLHVC